MTSRPKINYVLFDMDGLMVDSEKISADVTNRILGQYGKEATWEIQSRVMGRPQVPGAEILLSYFPDIPLTVESFLAQRNAIQDTLWPTVPLLPGIRKLVQHLKAHNIPIAVATSSTRARLQLKTSNLGDVFDCFDGKIVCSDDVGYNMKHKPSPDVFIIAAREMLGRDVGNGDECNTDQIAERARGLVFEDSIPGMQAGKRAGMSVVWVPDPKLLQVEYTGQETADQILSSVEHFVPEEWGLPAYE